MEHLISITKTKKILYVEDNYELRDSVVKLLENFFDHIIEAKDGREALEIYNQEFYNTNRYFDLILSDISMPHVNGIDLVDKIYNINAKQNIIMITAHSEKEYLIPLIKLGIHDFIQKPIDAQKIIQSLRGMVDKYWNKHISFSTNHIYNGEYILADNQYIELTKNEIKLLDIFIDNKDKFITLEDIHLLLHHNNPLKSFSSQSIRSLIKRLRIKVPQDCIKNNRTLGYKIELY